MHHNQNTSSRISKVLDWIFVPYSLTVWRSFETIVCIVMVYYFSSFLKTPDWWIGTSGYHVSARATSSGYLPPPPLIPDDWIHVVVVAFYFFSGMYILGYGRKVLNWVFFAFCMYVQAVDQPSAFTINRMLILYFFMFGLQPESEPMEAISIETSKDAPAQTDKPAKVSGWMVRIMQLTLGLQYSASGICKIEGGWIKIQNDTIVFNSKVVWTQSQGHYKNELAAWAVNDLPMFVWGSLAGATLFFELFAIFLFFWKRTRLATVIFGVCLHLGIAMLMKDLIYFSLQMLTMYIFFVPEKWVEDMVSGCRTFLQQLWRSKKDV